MQWIGRLGRCDPEALGAACRALAGAQTSRSPPIAVWTDGGESRRAFGVVVSRRFAPGRPVRWLSWAVSPLVASCRQLGAATYLEGEWLWLRGRRAARASVATAGACLVVTCAVPGSLPSPEKMESLLIACVEAQHGWQFENAWPDPREHAAIAQAREAAAAAAA